MIYNAILRQYPDKIFNVFKASNLYPTSIHVLQSAVVKLTRRAKLSPGLKLYRGLGGDIMFPPEFYNRDEKGRKGILEWGFMSTTGVKSEALKYSGIKKEKPFPTILEIDSGAVDRGADLTNFSQYPGFA